MNWSNWEPRFERFLRDEADAPADPAHDPAHTERVVRQAKRLARVEGAALAVVVPAAWLHDCAQTPKDSDERSHASAAAARRAQRFLDDAGYPAEH
ncbi:MAG: hydrolase, partial [Bacteroidetes bacterium QS_1_65_9]